MNEIKKNPYFAGIAVLVFIVLVISFVLIFVNNSTNNLNNNTPSSPMFNSEEDGEIYNPELEKIESLKYENPTL